MKVVELTRVRRGGFEEGGKQEEKRVDLVWMIYHQDWWTFLT